MEAVMNTAVEMTDEEFFSQFSEFDLRVMLRDRGLNWAGSKRELVNRLVAHSEGVVAHNAEIDGWN
jgi:hypothetical protein